MTWLRVWVAAVLVLYLGELTAWADPRLELVKSGTSSTHIDWVIVGTPSYSLDIRLNTDGNLASGIQFYISTTPADALTYGGTPLTVLNNPFTSSDLGLAPTSGSIVNASKQTAFFKLSAPDYPAFDTNAIATLQFNTASLAAGSYLFTPVGVEFTGSTPGGDPVDITDFVSPITFTLQVIPEPGSSVLLGVGGWALAGLRRCRSRPRLSALDARRAPADYMPLPRWKRTLDVGCILLASPLLVPLMLLVALAIKLTSGGRVLFRQERVGCMGRRFTCLKFRSMVVGADTAVHRDHLNRLIGSNLPMAKMDSRGDRRLIPCGRWLRVTALDELPQVLNVLRGEMSLVGPRPCIPYEYEQYEPWQKERFNTLPGLTGLWQVSGKNRTTFTEMIQLDIAYVRNRSLWLDMEIILKTVPALFNQVRDAREARQKPCVSVEPPVAAHVR